MTIMQDWLSAQAQVNPEKEVCIFNGNRGGMKYSWLNEKVQEFSEQCTLAGIGEGTKVAILASQDPSYLIILFTLIRIGAIVIPLNTRLTVDELNWQLDNTDCHIVLCWKHDLAQKLIRQDRLIYDITLNAWDDSTSGILPLPKKPTVLSDWGFTFQGAEQSHFNHLLDEIDKRIPQEAENPQPEKKDVPKPIVLENPFAIVHTSGTSGKPKGAVLTYGNVFYSAMASAYRIGHLPDDKWLCVLPLYHVGGLSIIIRAVLYGITVDLRQKFDVDEVNHALTHEEITLVSLVPTMLYRLLEARKEPWSPKLRLVLLGGAAASPELMQRCIDEGIPVATTYGMSEAASQIATTLPGDAVRKPGSVGKPLMFTQVRIVDENDNDVPPGEYGEIVVKSPTVMKEYYSNPEATAKTLRNGWLHTGDIGYLDADGDLFLVQRRSDLIVSGGENVYPAEVEAALRQHPAIKEVAVVGIPDTEWGQKVAAAIVLSDGQSLTQDEVEQHARQNLAGYKIPRVVKFVDELPQTASGKIQRPQVIELFVSHEDTKDTKQ